jgi:hypothetical protein
MKGKQMSNKSSKFAIMLNDGAGIHAMGGDRTEEVSLIGLAEHSGDLTSALNELEEEQD